jgi:hypothetical protein
VLLLVAAAVAGASSSLLPLLLLLQSNVSSSLRLELFSSAAATPFSPLCVPTPLEGTDRQFEPEPEPDDADVDAEMEPSIDVAFSDVTTFFLFLAGCTGPLCCC